jgi:hypothetical protein
MLSKKEPCVVHGLSVFLFFRELQKIRPPARKKNGGKLWAGPPNEEGNGDGDKGGGQATVMATKRVMATATMVVLGDKEGNGNDGSKSDGDSNEGDW